MEQLTGDSVGLIHLIASSLAMVTGSLVLTLKKGTKLHKKVGYVYVFSMVILLITAFMIFRLFNGWGVFHYTALLSTVTICLGMIPVLLRKPKGRWKYLHFTFMYWSVMGLYAAFAAEIFTRIPEQPFFEMVGLATGIIMAVGGVVFGLKKSKWKN